MIDETHAVFAAWDFARSKRESLPCKEGERFASVQVQAHFSGGIETEEQLDAAAAGLREEGARPIGAGKKVVLS